MKIIDSSFRSFVDVPEDSHFPIQNLPYGIFSTDSNWVPRVAVAIGDFVLDLSEIHKAGLFSKTSFAEVNVFDNPNLNSFMELGRDAWTEARSRISELLSDGCTELRDNAELRNIALIPQKDITLHLPVQIGDYTDFYASRNHATNIGIMLRGKDNALQPNYLHLPVGYHGRASSIVVSGTDIHRPLGQTNPTDQPKPVFGPSKLVDFELEMGFFVGTGNELGQPVSTSEARNQIFGMVLSNDWSARDIQKWEYVPLGPFLSKNFATSISPWVVTLDALQPFMTDGPVQDPEPLPYLKEEGVNSYDINLEVSIQSPDMDEPQTITKSNMKYLYWSIFQQMAHHTISGCNMNTGDMLATGTISGEQKEERGCMMELTWRGSEPIELSNGEQRKFIQDHDEIKMTGYAQGDGFRIGFGEVKGKILPAIDY